MTKNGEFESSELGTKEYWESIYDKEIINLAESDDCGEEWFGKAATNRMVNWIKKQSNLQKECAILDIGCGNGLLLLELSKHGFSNLVGVDYCEGALKLAKAVFNHEEEDGERVAWLPLDITNQTIVKKLDTKLYNEADIKIWDNTNLKSLPKEFTQCFFDLCTDKGSYDAISLCPENALGKREDYIKNVHKFLANSEGYLMITSCNWTKDELISHFSACFSFVVYIPAPSFSFGGKIGSTVSTCVFRAIQNK